MNHRIATMNTRSLWLFALAAAAVAAPSGHAGDKDKWSLDVSLYGLAAGMHGDVGIGPADAPVDFGFDKVWDNLEFAAMGKIRLGYDRWALTTDIVYMGLGASTANGIGLDLDQWVVEPTLSYRVCKYFEPLAGVRYNNISAEIRGAGNLPTTRVRSGTEEWWDPIIGANLTYPFAKNFSFNVRGDIGGFGVGSDFTWQAFPFFSWQFTKWGSLEAGYRWIYMDYENGSGASRFAYEMVNRGPQLGITFHF